MKRIFSVILALALAWALAAPAAAEARTGEGDMEAALTGITAAVKKTLDISDDYTEFSGHYNDGLRPGWNLYWSREGEDLSVTCDDSGVITEVYRWKSDDARQDFYGFDAHFPPKPERASRTEAEGWLARLMGQNERARIDRSSASLTTNGEYRFSGRVLMNGLESPVTFSIRIGADGLTGYNRSDSYAGYVGGVPAAKTAVDKAAAAAALEKAVTMDIYYVTDANGEARLRYVPTGPYTVVDALTGEAVDMDALYASFGGSAGIRGVMEEAAAAENAYDTGAGLTEVEISSIANYRDVLEEDALDAKLRSLPQIGLDGFALERCSYRMDADGNITASLRYSAEMTEDRRFGFSREAFDEYMGWNDRAVVYKYATMDAKTGALIDLGTHYPLWDGERSETTPEPSAAEAFLSAAAPEKLAESGAYEGSGPALTFARMHDGYFFPENALYVELSPEGTVDSFRYDWDENVVFAPSDGIVDEDAAQTAYIGALDVTLGYAAWPEGIDYGDPVLLRYADWGYTFVESLRLGYYYSGTDTVDGVDALTGEPILTAGEAGGYTYSDLADAPQRAAIEALAAAGVGFDGGAFEPGRALTQRDALRLLLQAAGYTVADWDEETLKNEAVWRGFVRADEWAPDAALTGAQLAQMMLGASRYGAAAALDGIWAAGYDDGYAAVASALGMTIPAGQCTRADGAQLLYEFMTR